MKRKILIVGIIFISVITIYYLFGKFNVQPISTTSTFHIHEKSTVRMEISGIDINSGEEMIIKVLDENVFNLIVEDKEYFILFEEGNNGKTLQTIELLK